METKIPELGRFAEPALLILVSLSDGPKHGYAIMTDVEAGTGRPMGPGTLYAALARLTAVGATVLAEQLRDLSEFASAGLRRLGQAQR
jgi:DNA-binding PadR family transcriptional regulator